MLVYNSQGTQDIRSLVIIMHGMARLKGGNTFYLACTVWKGQSDKSISANLKHG